MTEADDRPYHDPEHERRQCVGVGPRAIEYWIM
jgi:hypothetical protein